MRKANREIFYGNQGLWLVFLLYKFYFRVEITKSYVHKKRVISRCQTLIEFLKNKSSGPLNCTGLGGRETPTPTYNFGLQQNLTTNSLLFTGSLTNNINSLLTSNLCYMYYFYPYNKVSRENKYI